jgi:hypothetical protein
VVNVNICLHRLDNNIWLAVCNANNNSPARVINRREQLIFDFEESNLKPN